MLNLCVQFLWFMKHRAYVLSSACYPVQLWTWENSRSGFLRVLLCLVWFTEVTGVGRIYALSGWKCTSTTPIRSKPPLSKENLCSPFTGIACFSVPRQILFKILSFNLFLKLCRFTFPRHFFFNALGFDLFANFQIIIKRLSWSAVQWPNIILKF